MYISAINKFSVIVLTLLMLGCASIPSEAPELSVQIGNRVSAIEDANITLLQRFFSQKRQDIDRFIEDEWVPEFANSFFSNTKIANVWDTVVKNNDKKQRLGFIMKTGPKLQDMINKKRTELIAPLDDLERRIEKQLRTEYAQVRAMNNSITSFLLSASAVAENRNRYLGMMGITENKVGTLIDKTDEAVVNLVKGAAGIKQKVNAAKTYIDSLRNIRHVMQTTQEK